MLNSRSTATQNVNFPTQISVQFFRILQFNFGKRDSTFMHEFSTTTHFIIHREEGKKKKFSIYENIRLDIMHSRELHIGSNNNSNACEIPSNACDFMSFPGSFAKETKPARARPSATLRSLHQLEFELFTKNIKEHK